MLRRFNRTLGKFAYRAATILGYSPEMYAAIGGRSLAYASSGVRVTADTALKVAAWKRGIALVSEYIGKTPFHVKAEHVKVKEHPAWMLVRKWARYQQQSANRFRQTMIVHALTTGNGCAYIARNPDTFEPWQLRILAAGSCQAVLQNGVVRYKIDGIKRTVPAYNILHVMAFSDDGLNGLDPISSYARDVLGLSIAEQDYAAGYYAHGGSPTLYAHSESVMGDDEFNAVNKRLNDKGGLKNSLSNAHEIPICEGFSLENLTPTAEQSQLLSAREFSLKDIANALGVPLHKLQGDGKSSYKSLEEENRAFREDTLDPWLCQFEEQYSKLLTEDEQHTDSVRIEAVRESLTRTNMSERAAYLKAAIGGPWMTPAEGRDIDSLEPIDGTDELLKPANMNLFGLGDQQRTHHVPSDDQPSNDEPPDHHAKRDEYVTIGQRFADGTLDSRSFPDWLATLPDNELRTKLQNAYDTATREEFPAAVAAVLEGAADAD